MQYMDLPASIDALFVSNQTNVSYLTNFMGTDPTAREAYVLLHPDGITLFTSALYLEQVTALPNISVVTHSGDYPITQALIDRCKRLNIQRLGYESDDLTVHEFTSLKNACAPITLTATQHLIETKRTCKTEKELATIQKAADITDDCFHSILPLIRAGITETELAWRVESYFHEHNASSAFAPIVAFNQHASKPHYFPTPTSLLSSPSLILLDFGAKYDGYCADMTRVVFTGTPLPEWTHAYEIVLEANTTALALLTQGERSGKILDTQARTVIEKAGLPIYPHSLGHGVGRQIHESPRLTIYNDTQLKTDACVTVEPGVYIEGKFGIRIEDLVRIKQNGIDVLSHSSKELTRI